MSTAQFSRLITLPFLIILSIFLIVQNLSKPRVLVLHSYYTDFSWVRDINVGIKRELEKQSYKIRWHYMDTKRHPSLEFKARAGSTARSMIDKWQPDVLIAVDDNAQEYVSRYYLGDPNMKIVFTGVNKSLEAYNFHVANNVTGILERINYQAVKDILLQVLPKDKRRIMHISDASPTSEGIHDEIESFDWSPLDFSYSYQAETFPEWKKAIREAEGKTDFLLLTHYHTLKKSADISHIVKPQSVMDWTMRHSDLPGVSFWGFYVEDGGMMAVALSPYEQGEVAARMAIKILEDNKQTRDIPVQTSRLFVMYLRKSEIERKLGNLQLPLVYEAFARATNHYYE